MLIRVMLCFLGKVMGVSWGIAVLNIFLACSEFGIFMYWTCNSMNNLLSYCGLVYTRASASEKDLPVRLTDKKPVRWKFWPPAEHTSTNCKTVQNGPELWSGIGWNICTRLKFLLQWLSATLLYNLAQAIEVLALRIVDALLWYANIA